MHDLGLDAVLGEQSLTDGKGPGGVYARTEGGVDRHTPVAEFVAESLNDDGAIVG